MNYHRAIVFNPRFRQIGLFSLPYQLVFEAFAPVIECAGYVVLLVTTILGVLSVGAFALFMSVAAAINLFLSTLSVLLCVYSERGARAQTGASRSLPTPGSAMWSCCSSRASSRTSDIDSTSWRGS